MKAFSLLAPLVCAVYVSAHGILTNFAVNGQRQNKNVIRQVSTQDPNYGANNPALTCGPNSKPNSGIANVQPGDTLSFDWRTASGGTWPHNTGPMLTYLASCGDVTCDKFDASNARWFKVDQVGRKGNNGPWVQGDLMNGAVASMKLPSDLAPGNYLVRHEIIALHLANQIRKAEFYPGCAQLRVGGSGTGRPTNDELVRLPGAYNDNDPGLFGNFFDAGARYQFPGPKVATLVSGGNAAPPAPAGGDDDDDDNNNNNNKPSGDNGNNSSTPAAPAPTKKGSKSGSCKLKKRSPVDADTLAEDNVNLFKPRHISRVMRRIAFDLSH